MWQLQRVLLYVLTRCVAQNLGVKVLRMLSDMLGYPRH